MDYYLFPKFFQQLTVAELMSQCRELGLAGPTALIREGYWLTLDDLKTALPAFIEAAENEGLTVNYAQTEIPMAAIEDYEETLHLLKIAGITHFRVAHLKAKDKTGQYVRPPREMAAYAQSLAERTAKVAERAGLKAIIQIHGNCYPHNATTAYLTVKDLDPRFIGIKLDPGNNIQKEGFENYQYQIQLLGEYIGALGAKDASVIRDTTLDNDSGKGWRRVFMPAYEGMNDYHQVMTELQEIGFDGAAILMPFYHETDHQRMVAALRKEIDYFRDMEKLAADSEGF